VQLTDFENAAYVTFVVLLTRVILSFDLNLLIPLSKVRTENVSNYFTDNKDEKDDVTKQAISYPEAAFLLVTEDARHFDPVDLRCARALGTRLLNKWMESSKERMTVALYAAV